jgi:hypothetical protein
MTVAELFVNLARPNAMKFTANFAWIDSSREPNAPSRASSKTYSWYPVRSLFGG